MTELAKTSRSVRAGYLNLLKQHPGNCFLTFNFPRKISPTALQTKMRHFMNIMARELYGRRWAKIAPCLPTAIGFPEHLDSNTHYHVSTYLDAEQMNWMIADGPVAWKKLTGGQLHVEKPNSPERVRNYITKDLVRADTAGEVFIYMDERKSRR